jgi:IMP dehydrogenase
MSHQVICVAPELNIEACMALMTDKRVRHLLVRESGKIAGIISIGDIVKAVIDDQQFTIQQLEHYISGGG